MNNENLIDIEKPSDWPQNQREARLSNILYAIKRFEKEPNYGNKEILLSLLSEIDPNQYHSLGLMRISAYEIALINTLYLYSTMMYLPDLKIFLYKEITESTRLFNMLKKIIPDFQNVNDINNYGGLILPLKLYFIAYQNFNYSKNRSFCEELIDAINICETLEKQDEISLNDIEYAFTNLMYDLSNASAINTIPIIEFDREELLKLFKKEFGLIKKVNKNPTQRPLKGVLKMSIANWILRSRNCYNHSPVFKCLTNIASNSSVKNKEIWMQNVEYLNDKREGKMIKELFANKQWIQYNWAKKIKLNNPYTFYVTSFSKTNPTEKLKRKYGKNVYGYRSDKIATNVAPIINNHEFPQFGQTLSFDIIYDRNVAREELNFLFKIINELPLDDNDKIKFTNEIISYWFLSFKDKKWKDENERRYQIFYYDKYTYFDLNKDTRFIKIKSSIYLFPDNISNDNNQFKNIKANIFDRYYAIATKEFIQCNKCLNIDYELSNYEKDYICPICGSTNITKIDPNKLRKENKNNFS